MPVPFLSRLNLAEYMALMGYFLLVGAEAVIRILTLALPASLFPFFYRASRGIFNRLASPAHRRAECRRNTVSSAIRDASDFVELCLIFGYHAEEHITQTRDGYLLGLHRIAWRRGEESVKVNEGASSVRKRVVYLHHGLMMNSDVWVCLTDARRCLPFVLVERGFDVWFGNNRGNKYSKKSCRSSPTSVDFWNFSMDEFARYDVPDSIAYILDTTGCESLSYIGFSQGTAQAFATLAIHPKLNAQVDVFIGLAPAMSPAGLSNSMVDSLVKASPQVLFMLFGRRSILSSTTMWQSILYPPIYVRMIDLLVLFLFGWDTRNISLSQKLAAYAHLYSFSSTKSVVHWFQIIRTKQFQIYDDTVLPTVSLGMTSPRHTRVARYPTRNIKTPIVLLYGGRDSLVDIDAMLRELPSNTHAIEIPHYEHLDFLWARDVDDQVFHNVFDALDSFTSAKHSPEEYARYQLACQQHLNSPLQRLRRDSDTVINGSDSPPCRKYPAAIAAPHRTRSHSCTCKHAHPDQRHQPAAYDSTHSTHDSNKDDEAVSIDSPSEAPSPVLTVDGFPDSPAAPAFSKTAGVRRNSRGISLGASRAAGGVVTRGRVEVNAASVPEDDVRARLRIDRAL